jgi:hypothetical protein
MLALIYLTTLTDMVKRSSGPGEVERPEVHGTSGDRVSERVVDQREERASPAVATTPTFLRLFDHDLEPLADGLLEVDDLLRDGQRLGRLAFRVMLEPAS